MKRRLTVSILLAVATALLLVGIGTLVFARFGARRAAEDELRNQVESTANLVSLGQQRIGQINSADAQLVRNFICKVDDTQTPGTTAPSRSNQQDLQRVQAAICASPSTGLADTQAKICDELPARVEQSLDDGVRSSRDTFCATPTEANLDLLRSAYCKANDTGPISESGAKRRAEQSLRYLCSVVQQRTESRENLQSALSKESIDLLVFDRGDTLVEGQLPAGVEVGDIDPARLRQGETVSGPAGDARFANGSFAATAVDPSAENLNVIVIARAADPVQGVVPWFLLASGVTLLIGLVVASSLSKKLTQPLREATAVTGRIADGDLSVRLPEHPVAARPPTDELELLAHSINSMAAALERSRGVERQFLLSVSHDLRTPLTSIRGYAEAIADGAAPDAQRAAEIILTESRRLERLVKDLLDLAKLDARRFTFDIREVDLDEIAADSVHGFRREVEDAGLRIVLEESPAPATGYADPDRLAQVIANLVENALKYASSTITVRVGTDATASRIEVIDDGPGIAQEDLRHVFERLYVTGATPRRKEAGSGLGLAIVRELVEAMGGRVEARPDPTGEGGTCMVVTVPPSRPADPPAPPTESA